MEQQQWSSLNIHIYRIVKGPEQSLIHGDDVFFNVISSLLESGNLFASFWECNLSFQCECELR